MTTENSKNRKTSPLARSFHFHMEQNFGSPTVFSANQCTDCSHDFEFEITRGNCITKGHAADPPSRCPSGLGITMQSYTEKKGLKITQFIIPERVPARGDIQPPRSAAAPSPPGPSTKSG
ncbi:hypothetical protein IMY05_010G0025600 [Salix suchowensis]|nr:hypothetical protein IMY05_010G0025600 [Salix suchowensis]